MSIPDGPLRGLRVIDLTQMLAGPYGTMILADLGADVIKIEPPKGDLTRGVGPYRSDDAKRHFGGYFQSVNRGKRSVVLDLKQDEGREHLLALVEHADVVVENFSVGVMDRLGVSYEVLSECNPRLVYASSRGFGDPRTGASPYGEWPAFDIVIQAMGGLLGITGTEDGRPIKAGPGVADIFPGTLMALGILAAVLRARETGHGEYVDVAMYDAVLSLCERIVYQYSYDGSVPAPQGNEHPLLSPYDVLPASDGWITLAAPADTRWRRLCELIGRPELADDRRYTTNYLRSRRSAEVRDVMSAWTSTRTRAEIIALLGGEVPVGPVNTIADIFQDPHPHLRGMLVELEQPGSATPVTVAGQPIKFLSGGSGVRSRAPLLGEHTEEVLAEIGRVAIRNHDAGRSRADP